MQKQKKRCKTCKHGDPCRLYSGNCVNSETKIHWESKEENK